MTSSNRDDSQHGQAKKYQDAACAVSVDRKGVVLRWQDQIWKVQRNHLVAAGWVHAPQCSRRHCDSDDCNAQCPEENSAADLHHAVYEALRLWHDEERHDFPIRICDFEPCMSVAVALGLR